MFSSQKEYVIIGAENKFDDLQLIILGWRKHLRIIRISPIIHSGTISFLRKLPFMRKYLQSSLNNYTKGLATHKGLWYEMSQEVIDLTQKFYDKYIKNEGFIAYFNKLLDTNKFEAHIKKAISLHIGDLLNALYIINSYNLTNKTVLMVKTSLSEFVVNYVEDKYQIKYQIAAMRPLGGLFSLLTYYGWVVKEIIRRGVVFFKTREKYKLCKEAVWGFHSTTMREDILIDDSKFKKSDMLLFAAATKEPQRLVAYNEAKERGFPTVSLADLKVNIRKNFFGNFFFYVWSPLRVYLEMLIKGDLYLFYYIFVFYRQCFSVELLMNLYDINCNISIKDGGDVPETIIFNKYGTKNVIFHWSDLTTFKDYNYAFMAQDVYFVWGDEHYSYHSDNCFVGKKIDIGCIYKEQYRIAVRDKDMILARINPLPRNKKIVSFFDACFLNTFYSEEFFLEYLDMIDEFCKNNQQINVLLKSKLSQDYQKFLSLENRRIYQVVWHSLNNYDNFKQITPPQWSAEQIIAVSDLVINMGMNSPATIGLICGKDALYFDNTGNVYHPFARRYMDSIVFDNKEHLFRQIDNILKGKVNCRNFIKEEEIRRLDAFSDDRAIERLRKGIYDLTLA